MFFANKEISRRSTPGEIGDPLKSLEEMFFVSQASQLLIEIAIAARVIDDQMKKLPIESNIRILYYTLKERVDQYPYGLFDDLKLNLRKTCNKIIHADAMEPHFSEGEEAHELDSQYKYDGGDKIINWQHMNGYIRLSGEENGIKWNILLDIQVFARGIYSLFQPMINYDGFSTS